MAEITVKSYAEFSSFKYHESPRDARDFLFAEPNTQIEGYGIRNERNLDQWMYYLQTNESNIVECRYDDDDSVMHITRVVYA